MSLSLSNVASQLNLELLNDSLENWKEISVNGGYSSDLLSIVMSDASPGYLWITKQVHMNVIAVAALTELAGIITCGKKPEEKVLQKAVEEGIPVFYADESAFNVAGKLYCLLHSGCEKND